VRREREGAENLEKGKAGREGRGRGRSMGVGAQTTLA